MRPEGEHTEFIKPRHNQQVQNFLNWFNENLMKGKLDEICG